MARILAIDYGLKRCGLAWTDPNQIIATGIGGVAESELKDKIKSILSAEQVECIVLGFPTRTDGSDTHTTQAVMDLKKVLEAQHPGMKIVLWDERFTSKMAMQALIKGGAGKKKRRDKSLIDEVSATIILQEYLESIS